MTNDALNTNKNIIHMPLKMLRCTGDPKGKFVKTKSPKMSQECCQKSRLWIQKNLLFVSIFEKTFVVSSFGIRRMNFS